MRLNIPEVRRAYYSERPRESRFMTTAVLDVRAAWGLNAEPDTFHVQGFASTTGAPYEVNDWLGSYNETIARGAFTKTLQERDDTRFLVNHDGIPLARSASGTLSLREITDPKDDPQGKNQTGLWIESDLDTASPLAQTLRSAMLRGDVSQMSFAFQAIRQEWNEDYTERSVNEVKLFDVSAVTYPANPLTSIDTDAAGLMGRLDARGVSAEDRALIGELLTRAAAEDATADDADEAALEPRQHDESDAEAVELKNRQNKLDALKRRYTN